MKLTTAHFRVKKIIERLDAGKGDLLVPIYTFIVERRIWKFWWRTEKYYRQENSGVCTSVVYNFNTEAEALAYINKTNYTTKVLWNVEPAI